VLSIGHHRASPTGTRITTMRFLDETNLLTRDDTFFGVCQGLGEDLGISGNWFRLALALTLFFSPLGAVVAYAVGGVLVFTSRMLVPNRASKAFAHLERSRETPTGQNDSQELAVAA